MSSLAAARADNFYVDPENPQKPSKKLKRNADNNLVVRFEMPFDVQCLGCQLSIGKGVRFNAEKFKAGSYYSTTIWGFRMKSPCCKTPIEIHTNPKEADYVVVAGARRRARSLRVTDHKEGTKGIFSDPNDTQMSKLEKKLAREKLTQVNTRNLEFLRERSYDRYGDDVERNRELRGSMRSARNDVRKREKRRDELGLSGEITLLPETKLDRARASAVVFHGNTRDKSVQKRKEIMKQGIFSGRGGRPGR